MEPAERHALASDASFDGGDVDCGSGLLLLIRKHIDPLDRGGLLEIRSTEISVDEDLPAWCRLTGNELVSWTRQGRQRSFLVCKGALSERRDRRPPAQASPAVLPSPFPVPAPAPPIAALSAVGIGSWPRPRWMVRAVHDRIEGRLPDAEFQAIAEDAVRAAVEAQLRAGAGAVTDGEQRRDNYASFVGLRLDACQLVPLTDLLALVEEPEKLKKDLDSLDVPASEVRHPVVFDRLRRTRPLAAHEVEFVRTLTDRPVKVALPGPYLLTRTMWMDCLPNNPYDSREELAGDIVRVLREELFALLATGASVVQFDEPVLTEVVFTGAKNRRTFMCGALSKKKDPAVELAFARGLLRQVLEGAPRKRTAIHVCRGNWTRDERVALAGDYRPLLPLLAEIPVGTYFLEMSTPRAGEMDVLRDLPREARAGVGVVNQKLDTIEPVEEILARARRAVDLFGADRVLLAPDCGFATFADNPVAVPAVAEAKLAAIARAAEILRRG